MTTTFKDKLAKHFFSVYSIVLFYLMYFLNDLIRIDGLNDIGGQIIKFFILAIISTVIANIIYEIFIVKLDGNKTFKKILFYTLNYPAEFLFPFLLFLILKADNVNQVYRTDTATFLILVLSIFIRIPTRELIEYKYKDIRQQVWQESSIQVFSLFITILLALLVPLVLGYETFIRIESLG